MRINIAINETKIIESIIIINKKECFGFFWIIEIFNLKFKRKKDNAQNMNLSEEKFAFENNL